MTLNQQQPVQGGQENSEIQSNIEPSIPEHDTGKGFYSPAEGVIAESGTKVSEGIFIPGETAHKSYIFPKSIDELLADGSPWSKDYEKPTVQYAQAAGGGELEINDYKDIRYYMEDNKEFKNKIHENWDRFQDETRVYDYSYEQNPHQYLYDQFTKRDAAIAKKIDPTFQNPYRDQEVEYRVTKGMQKHPEQKLPDIFGRKKTPDLSSALADNEAVNAPDQSKSPGMSY